MGDRAVSVLIKKRWKSEKKGMSLRAFAEELVAAGDQMAKDWFAHKQGSLNESRSDVNKTRASLERQATKSARQKKKGGAKTPAKTE